MLFSKNLVSFRKHKFVLNLIRSLKEALEAYQCNLSQDVPIVQEIRNEVRKLNTKTTIWEKITNLERDLRLTAAMERLIAPMMDQVKKKIKSKLFSFVFFLKSLK